ncbi:MAG: fused MFS/spermidine synthase [Deltaproteobacteria bacterium]|jgi:spermidine synthase|nr:fused MFS/spermidine synthase [Deltaproteobacteria bacterium]
MTREGTLLTAGKRFILPLIFLSGLCALAYQVSWFREFRLVFGNSTGAHAAVLAIFMGGLGLGGLFIGRVADRSNRPLFIYGLLEILIAASALLTPFLTGLAGKLYIASGGVSANGLFPATLIRLGMALAVLGIPTFLMGGTLPALAAALENRLDRGRRYVALAYGVNTLGGVFGVLLATFYFLEMFGNRQTIWLAGGVNLLVGCGALLIYHAHKTALLQGPDTVPAQHDASRPGIGKEASLVSPSLVYLAAFIVGFCFFLMELVWYRMLAPILGGTTYTFALILATALAGIGTGAGFYRIGPRERRVTVLTFIVTCGLEALLLALPFGLGDRIAILAEILGIFSFVGFAGNVIGWTIICLVVVFPAAAVAGFQFPVLIGLLGQGRDEVGRHTGFVYAWNTAGAILGALAGGFGFMTLFSAPGCWQGAVIALTVLGLFFLAVKWKSSGGKAMAAVTPVALFILALAFIAAEGPTAAWRHSTAEINWQEAAGAENETRKWLNDYRRRLVWEKDGIESSIGITASDGLSLIINGKSDGNVSGDAGTQVMAPMIGAVLHPNPQKAMVIGLGTGTSSGWLGRVDTIEKVDTIELESAVLELVRRSGPVNQDVLANEKVNIIIGDGRENLLTSKEKYDIIFSEPSNLHRVGISSLYTREFYQAVANRLNENGLFTQWVQAYYVAPETLRTLYATLASVFPYVETWTTNLKDIAFVCSMKQITYDVPSLRQRLNKEPYRAALAAAWGMSGLEGFLAGFLANHEVAGELAEKGRATGMINTDDRMLVEFGFARTYGKTGLFSEYTMRSEVRYRGQHQPQLQNDTVDWDLVDAGFLARNIGWFGDRITRIPGLSEQNTARLQVYSLFLAGNFYPIVGALNSGVWQPVNPFDMVVLSTLMAENGDDSILEIIIEVRQNWPGLADAIMARYYWRKNMREKALGAMEKALYRFRTDPWQNNAVMSHTLNIAMEMARTDKEVALRLEKGLAEPFSVHIFDDYRNIVLTQVAAAIDNDHGLAVMEQWEPHVPWQEAFLQQRLQIYTAAEHPGKVQAEKDLREFLKNKKQQLLFE